MLIGLNCKNKKIKLEVEKCGVFGMIRGLMFRSRERAPALLLFDFKKPRRLKIHSWFVFFPFIAIWLDEKEEIIEIKRVGSWKTFVLPKKSFSKLVEIPINGKYMDIINQFDFLDEDEKV